MAAGRQERWGATALIRRASEHADRTAPDLGEPSESAAAAEAPDARARPDWPRRDAAPRKPKTHRRAPTIGKEPVARTPAVRARVKRELEESEEKRAAQDPVKSTGLRAVRKA